MSLHNVTVTNSRLLATNDRAHCVSEQVIQDTGDTDFESIREARVHWYLQNIADEPFCTADRCITVTPVAEGERIFIRTNDGVVHDTIATGVEPETSSRFAAMESNTLPAGTASSSGGTAWHAFDADEGTTVSIRNSSIPEDWLQYQVEDNTPHIINQYYLHSGPYHASYTYLNDWKLQGSLDGINWSTISNELGQKEIVRYGHVYDVHSPGPFSYYRILCTRDYSNHSNTIQTFSLMSDEGTLIDTQATTQGEIPDQVFKYTDTVTFNGGQAVEKDVFYEYGTTGIKLHVISLYEDVLLSGRILVTRADFTATGNEVKEITGQIFKEV